MPTLIQSPTDLSAAEKQVHVYLMDPWSFIPYYMARLSAALRAESVDVTLGSVRYHLDRQYFQKAGLTPDRLLLDFGGGIRSRTLRRLVKSCEYAVNLFLLGIRLAVSRPDVLHVQYLPLLEHGIAVEAWFLQWVRMVRLPIVYTAHNVTHSDSPERGRALLRRVYHAADALICHGEKAKAELVSEFGVPAEKIRIIPHGPLFEERSNLSAEEARAKLNINSKEPLVVALGVISEYKGIPFLLDAWEKLKRAGTPGRLLIAGTGNQQLMDDIRRKVNGERLSDSVDLRLEFIPVEELPLLYQSADILVYPYKAGTTSGALLTGLRYGKAVVATRLPFFQEHLKDGETALLVDYGNTDALASALRNLIQEPQRRAVLGTALLDQASRGIGWREIAAKTRRCYEELAR